jgi:hypothetical protein
MDDAGKRAEFERMGRHRVARTVQTHGFNADWTRVAAQWLAEQDDAADVEAKRLAERSVKLSGSAALAGWLALIATIGFGLLQLFS